MIFKDSKKFEAYYFPFNWGAEYFDGTYLTEFDLSTNKKNDFYSIQQEKLLRFGLYGAGMKMFYNQDGSFNLAGQHIEIEYHTKERVYPLTINFETKDCITYKYKEKDFDRNFTVQDDRLVSIDFGYKTLLNYDGIQFFFQPVVRAMLPTKTENGRVQIEVKMTSNQDMNGQIVFKNKGVIINQGNCPLIINKSTTVDWVVH